MQVNAVSYLRVSFDFRTTTKLIKWNNVHMRRTAKVGKDKYEYMHALHLDRARSEFHGHICGNAGFELFYTVDQNATIKILVTNTGLSNQEDFSLIDADFKAFIKRIEDGEKKIDKFRDTTKKGKFYLKRQRSTVLSKAAYDAIVVGAVTNGFALNCLSWGLKIREGVR